jgi:hypothetical protein
LIAWAVRFWKTTLQHRGIAHDGGERTLAHDLGVVIANFRLEQRVGGGEHFIEQDRLQLQFAPANALARRWVTSDFWKTASRDGLSFALVAKFNRHHEWRRSVDPPACRPGRRRLQYTNTLTS